MITNSHYQYTIGGICDDIGGDSSTFNTGIVTLVNFNTRVSNVVAGLTFTHEAGHNFGSQVGKNTCALSFCRHSLFYIIYCMVN